MSKAVEYEDKIIKRAYEAFKEITKDGNLVAEPTLENIKNLTMPYQFKSLEKNGSFQKVDKIFEKSPTYDPQEPTELLEKIEKFDPAKPYDLKSIRELLVFCYMIVRKESIDDLVEIIVDEKK
jgi:hypothetical protein